MRAWTVLYSAGFIAVGPACRVGPLSSGTKIKTRTKVPPGRRDLLPPAPRRVWPVIGFEDQTCLDWIVPNIRDDLIILLVRPGPVVKPLALPEALAVRVQKLGGLMAGPALEAFQGVLETGISHFAKQMKVCRHHHIFEHLPIAALVAVVNGVAHHHGDVRLRQVWVPLGLVEPKLHFSKDPALKAQSFGFIVLG